MATAPDPDDELLEQIGDLGEAITAAHDQALDPDLRDMAQHVAETGAESLAAEHGQS